MRPGDRGQEEAAGAWSSGVAVGIVGEGHRWVEGRNRWRLRKGCGFQGEKGTD